MWAASQAHSFFSSCWQCPDSFVVGYGMDFAERFRSLPCIGVLKPEVYQEAS